VAAPYSDGNLCDLSAQKCGHEDSSFREKFCVFVGDFEKYHCFTLKWGQDHKFIMLSFRGHSTGTTLPNMVGFAPQKLCQK
jgi:hypothetical protein